MASLTDDLNGLLERTRAGLEAARAVAEEVEETDPDIERGLEDVVSSERWSSSGLYHRVAHLDGTPSILATDLPSRIATQYTLFDKLKMICREQHMIAKQARAVLSREDLDEPTRELLVEIRELHARNARWCEQTLEEWEPGGSSNT